MSAGQRDEIGRQIRMAGSEYAMALITTDQSPMSWKSRMERQQTLADTYVGEVARLRTALTS